MKKPSKTLQALVSKINENEYYMDHIEHKIRTYVLEIKKLKPTKEEIEEYGLQEIFDQYD